LTAQSTLVVAKAVYNAIILSHYITHSGHWAACQLTAVDYISLDMLNVKMMQTGSSDSWGWRLREPVW